MRDNTKTSINHNDKNHVEINEGKNFVQSRAVDWSIVMWLHPEKLLTHSVTRNADYILIVYIVLTSFSYLLIQFKWGTQKNSSSPTDV